ncbi:MAG: hypothetical protein C0617_09505 [Desulfuromonas sp.]|nr:MAG: hypothetical protein C0617_09505 [Desulfuromonas sp.]
MGNPVEIVDKALAGRSLGKKPSPSGPVLGIFAKEPLAGRVKTRLCPALSPGEAARLYRVSLDETVAAMSGPAWTPVVFFEGSEDFFRSAFPGLSLVPQGSGDLGERMERALGGLLGDGWEAAALIGSDSPDLPPALVEEAFEALAGADLVTVPSRDGGYVLVGESRHHPGLFREIPWSTAEVLRATRRRAGRLGATYREVGAWEDVDDLVSLRRLLERSPGCATARWARSSLADRL